MGVYLGPRSGIVDTIDFSQADAVVDVTTGVASPAVRIGVLAGDLFSSDPGDEVVVYADGHVFVFGWSTLVGQTVPSDAADVWLSPGGTPLPSERSSVPAETTWR